MSLLGPMGGMTTVATQAAIRRLLYVAKFDGICDSYDSYAGWEPRISDPRCN